MVVSLHLHSIGVEMHSGQKRLKAVYQVTKLPIYASLTLTKARAGLPFMIPASKAGEVKFHLLYI